MTDLNGNVTQAEYISFNNRSKEIYNAGVLQGLLAVKGYYLQPYLNDYKGADFIIVPLNSDDGTKEEYRLQLKSVPTVDPKYYGNNNNLCMAFPFHVKSSNQIQWLIVDYNKFEDWVRNETPYKFRKDNTWSSRGMSQKYLAELMEKTLIKLDPVPARL